MLKYLTIRILTIIPIILGVVFLVFTIMSFSPGTPGRTILGNTATQEAVDELNDQLGFSDPFFVRFFNYVKDAVTKFDFGTSYANRRPVMDQIAARFPTTLLLATSSIIFAAIIGVSFGVLSAVKQYSLADTSVTVLALFLASMPPFWFGMILMRFFALELNLVPTSGLEEWTGIILPVVTIALTSSAGLMRMTRTTLLETIRQDYVRTARAKGAPEKTVILRHALKNAMLPVITSIGLMFGASLGGTVVIESVFGLPGLGTLILTAIRQQDIPMVLAATIFLATVFCLCVLLVDVAYMVVDPRIKAKFAKGK